MKTILTTLLPSSVALGAAVAFQRGATEDDIAALQADLQNLEAELAGIETRGREFRARFWAATKAQSSAESSEARVPSSGDSPLRVDAAGTSEPCALHGRRSRECRWP